MRGPWPRQSDVVYGVLRTTRQSSKLVSRNLREAPSIEIAVTISNVVYRAISAREGA